MDKKSRLEKIRSSSSLVVFLICISISNDCLLLTLVDPILPEMLYNLEHPDVLNLTDLNVTTNEPARDQRYSDDINNQGRYGYLIAAKGIAQFICNPFVGYVVTKFGYRKPMLFGNGILIISTLAFPFCWDYWSLMGTRIIQGLASSLTEVTGFGMVAAMYKDDYERGKVIGYLFVGVALGIIVLQLITIKTGNEVRDENSSFFRLLKDRYIMIIAMNIFLLNLDVSIVLAFLPIRLLDLSNPSTWQLGIVVLPMCCSYLGGNLIFPRMVRFFPRWLQGFVGLFLSAITLFGLAYSLTFTTMLIVTFFMGSSIGMISTAMQPILALVVDRRHSKVYGNVYAISDMAICLSMSLGPLIGGPVVYAFGFEVLVFGAGILDLIFCPFSMFLRHIPSTTESKQEEKPLIIKDIEITKK